MADILSQEEIEEMLDYQAPLCDDIIEAIQKLQDSQVQGTFLEQQLIIKLHDVDFIINTLNKCLANDDHKEYQETKQK